MLNSRESFAPPGLAGKVAKLRVGSILAALTHGGSGLAFSRPLREGRMFNSLAFALPGGIEWVIILVVAILIFGRRLPEIMRGMGSSVREFKKGVEVGEEKGDKDDAPSANPPSSESASAPVKSVKNKDSSVSDKP